MNRLLIPVLVLTGLVVTQGQGHAQLLGVTVCGTTVGIGVGGSSTGVGYGYGYGYGAGYGAAPMVHCPLGGAGFGYGAPAYGAAPAVHCPIGFGCHPAAVGYGYSYAAPAYGGSSCHGGFGMAYGAPNYGTSCHGGFGMAYGGPGYGIPYPSGGPSAGYSGPLVGVHYHPVGGAIPGVSAPNHNVGVPGPFIRWDPSDDASVPYLGGPKRSSKLDSKAEGGRDDFAALMADIDRAQAVRPLATTKSKANDTNPATDFGSVLADIDRAQARRSPSNRTNATTGPDRTGSGGQ